MLDQEEIDQQQKLLEAHRRTLAHSLEQYNALGVLTPSALVHSIREAWTTIAQIKTTLHASGVDVADDPLDEPRELHITVPTLTPTERRNRQRMLQKVRDFWIKGVLENSLHGAALIELGMEYKPDAVQHPWDMVIQQPGQPTHTISPDTKIIDVFNELGGELLILGAPGSGKTTIMLELARDLIAHAEMDENHPMPVIFNLSSWEEKRRPLIEWLVDELNTKYDIPRKIGTLWVNDDQILLLLDGLDEVKQEQRKECVEALNQFRQTHGLVNIAVCSRITDYEALGVQLRLQDAVLLQPLTTHQIDVYLTRMGTELTGALAAVRSNEILRELVQTPLLLSIVAFAYRGMPIDTLLSRESFERQRTHIFDVYIRRMFERRSVTMPYTIQRTCQWLSWLSFTMSQRVQTIFYIDRLQPQWLLTHEERQWYYRTAQLADGLAFGLVGGLFVGSILGLLFGIAVGLVAAFVTALTLGIILAIFLDLPERSTNVLWEAQFAIGLTLFVIWIVQHASEMANWCPECGGTIILVLSVPSIMLSLLTQEFPQSRFILDFLLRLRDQILWLLIIWIAMTARLPQKTAIEFNTEIKSNTASWLRQNIRKIEAVDALGWSWAKAKIGFVTRLVRGVTSGFAWGILLSMMSNVVIGLIVGIVISIVISLTGGLVVSEMYERVTPNQGIRRSIQNLIRIGISGGIIGALVGGLIGALAGEWRFGVVSGTASGLASGLAIGLVYGGIACVQHSVLRLILYRQGYAPLNYAHFLDHCAERIFLRKVGGGYIFIHRMLMEYFASLDTSQSPEQTSAQSKQ